MTLKDNDVFNNAAAIQARDEGMVRVDQTASDAWKTDMAQCIVEVCKSMEFFTADDVFELAAKKGLQTETSDRRAFGPVMMRAAKTGICMKADCAPRPSNRKSLHASPLSVWRSLTFNGARTA